MADFGGVMRFTYDGNAITLRAKVDIEPGDSTFSAEHNQNGSYDRYVQPMGPAADLEFVDSADGVNPVSLDWNKIMSGGPYNMAITEESNGIVHQFTAASFVGRVKIDRLKGLVSGVTIQCRTGGYKQLTA